MLPPSKGKNLQVQCTVFTEIGVVHYALQRGSIKMNVNAASVEEVYRKTKEHPVYEQEFSGKKIVIVLDNAPAHNQTEERVQEHDDMVLFRLGPYSPMCNPIEGSLYPYGMRVMGVIRMTQSINECCVGCFSVLKARIKSFLALHREDMLSIGSFSTLTARRMDLLEHAVTYSMPFIDNVRIIWRMALHCQISVAGAIRNEDMHFGA